MSEVKNVKVPRPTLEPFIDDYKTALSELGSSLTTSKTSLLRYQASMQVDDGDKKSSVEAEAGNEEVEAASEEVEAASEEVEAASDHSEIDM
jgi:DNA polymerase III sliding clamp (beta) subunit (PCNA family)